MPLEGFFRRNRPVSEKLPKLPGFGTDLSSKLAEIITTGKLSLLEELKHEIPEGLLALLKLPGLGPKRTRILQEKLGVKSLHDLRRVMKTGKLRTLPGFGSKIESQIAEGLAQNTRAGTQRYLLATASQMARSLVEYLKESKAAKQIVVGGSFRRRLETVGDLDILASCQTPLASSRLMEKLISYEDVAKVLSHGSTRSSVRLRSGIQVDLRVVPEGSFGAALHYFTGSKPHNIEIRRRGLKSGLKINEYGIFKGTRQIGGRTEEDVFKSVDLEFIAPELRENRGEIEAASKGTLPNLVTLQDIRGDLHAHTQETDGRLSLEQMAHAAQNKRYEYLAITDHSRHLTVARGLTPARLRRQIDRIDQFNERSSKFKILKSIEVDILEDGSLDLPDDVLALLDLTVCSIHSRFKLSLAKQTDRILRAMDDPYFNILGHPSGRIIDQRQPYEFDLQKVLIAAHDRGCFLEVNAQPERMDLIDIHCKMAKTLGVKVSISTDAHSEYDLNHMELGVGQARRGWLEATDVLNTRSWSELRKLLKRK
jgi:DNA polymerase (family 10)